VIGSIIVSTLAFLTPVYALAAVRKKVETKEAWIAFGISTPIALLFLFGYISSLFCG
jgi:hypothetical protein